MRRGLLMSLGAAAILAAATTWTDRPVRAVAAVAIERSAVVGGRENAPRATMETGAPVLAAFAAGRGQGLDDAKRDIFGRRAEPPSPPAPASPAVASTAPPAVASTAPPASNVPNVPSQSAAGSSAAPVAVVAVPQMQLRFVGRMAAVDGSQWHYLARGASEFPVVTGQQLDEGYAVTSLSEEAVTLVHAPSGTAATVPIPRDRTR